GLRPHGHEPRRQADRRGAGRLARRPSAQVTALAPDAAIRARRKLTNRLIAAHDSERLPPPLTDDMLLIAGDGGLIQGADAVVSAFAGQFADPAFLAYV